MVHFSECISIVKGHKTVFADLAREGVGELRTLRNGVGAGRRRPRRGDPAAVSCRAWHQHFLTALHCSHSETQS
jgi:hypothetical protein